MWMIYSTSSNSSSIAKTVSVSLIGAGYTTERWEAQHSTSACMGTTETHVSKSEQTFGEAKTLGRNIPRCSW